MSLYPFTSKLNISVYRPHGYGSNGSSNGVIPRGLIFKGYPRHVVGRLLQLFKGYLCHKKLIKKKISLFLKEEKNISLIKKINIYVTLKLKIFKSKKKKEAENFDFHPFMF